jgi:5-oxoprolinase (ATP-hydrolysing) subunit A
MKWDINCDLGEGESIRRIRALMRYITSANIACGGHAGDVRSMRLAVREAVKQRIRIGAHPGLADRKQFGRNATNIRPEDFATLLIQQIAALEKITAAEGGKLHHVKLHGALYHMSESDVRLRDAYLSIIMKYWPRLIIFALAGGSVVSRARELGHPAWPEGFLDRAYRPDGTLVPRTKPGAILGRPEFLERLNSLRAGGPVDRAEARTWCVHSDSPHAPEFARAAHRKLHALGAKKALHPGSAFACENIRS